MRSSDALLRAFVELHPVDAARTFETLGLDEMVRLFKRLSTKQAVALLERITAEMGARLFAALEVERARELLAATLPRVASAIVRQLDDDTRAAILTGLDASAAAALQELGGYPADVAGAMMEPRVASLSIDLTAQQAIAKLRKTPRDVLHYLYVTERDGKLIGVLNMRDLLLASPRDAIDTLVRREMVTIPDTMNHEEVVRVMRERGFLALPVVDFDGRLVGVIKQSEVLGAGQLEAFEDLQKLVGAGADERALSPVTMVVKRRLPWLFVNLGTAFLAAAVVGLFEGIIAKIAALAVLLPVVAGQGGNTGSQSLAVVMRGIALREVIPGVKKRVIVKEVLGGLFNGIAIAVVTAGAVFAWRLAAGDTVGQATGMAMIIGLAMVANMVAAAGAGAVIPLLLKTFGQDPAQSAAIFLTTVTDIIGFAAFLGLATLLSAMIL
ncbi:MAG: magnesium transporter [Nitrospirota bacterium]|jgi:magnesium transporter